MNPAELPLRDWRDPDAISWWPPAPGWWIALALLILAAVVTRWLWRRWKRPNIKKLARKALEQIRANSDLSDSDRIRQISILVRRICLSAYARTDVAALTGRDWLVFLEKDLVEKSFSEGPGKVLVDAPYRNHAEIDLCALFSLLERWIQSLPDSMHVESIKKNKADFPKSQHFNRGPT